MAVEVAPPSVTYPSDHGHQQGILEAAEEGSCGWWSSAVVDIALFKLEKT